MNSSLNTMPLRKNSGVCFLAQEAYLKRLQVIAHNLSNAQTTGYKTQHLTFQNIPQKAPQHHAFHAPKTTILEIDPQQGPLQMTKNPWNVALTTPGYFKIKDPSNDSIHYTRDGHFFLSPEGTLITSSGFSVLSPDDTPINTPKEFKDIHISSSGWIYQGKHPLGQIGVFSLSNTSLEPDGHNMYTSQEAPTKASEPSMMQGYLEESNVSPVAESIEMIDTQRLFQYIQKALEDFEQSEKKVINVSARNA